MIINFLIIIQVIMISMGILGEYMWRTFDASRNRPPYIIEKENDIQKKDK